MANGGSSEFDGQLELIRSMYRAALKHDYSQILIQERRAAFYTEIVRLGNYFYFTL